MDQYRKKPVVIEAIQFKGKDSISEMYDKWLEMGLVLGFYVPEDDSKITLETREGDMTVSLEDYIIKGIAGEFYPCKPDIFEKTYEKVEK